MLLNYLTILVSMSILNNVIENKPTTTEPSDCLIKNIEYPDEFLYTYNEMFRGHFKRVVYTNPVKFISSFDQILWTFQPIAGMNNTFHIRNYRYDEYLCSTTNHLDMFNFRRKLNTNKLSKESLASEDEDRNCMWKIDPLDKEVNRYHIWNVMFEEPLYAASSLLKTAKSRRNVYTWHKIPDSRQFIWYIYCFPPDVYN